MSYKCTILVVQPREDVDQINDGIALSTNCRTKVYQSWQELIAGSCHEPDDRRVLVVEIELTAGVPKARADTDQRNSPASKSGQIADDCQVSTLTSIASGEPLIDPQVLRLVASEFRRVRQDVISNRQIGTFNQRLQQLSPRELDVLILIMRGRSCKEVAAKLAVGLATVAKHRASIFKKLKVRNSIELLLLLNAVFIQRMPQVSISDSQQTQCSTNGQVGQLST